MGLLDGLSCCTMDYRLLFSLHLKSRTRNDLVLAFLVLVLLFATVLLCTCTELLASCHSTTVVARY